MPGLQKEQEGYGSQRSEEEEEEEEESPLIACLHQRGGGKEDPLNAPKNEERTA